MNLESHLTIENTKENLMSKNHHIVITVKEIKDEGGDVTGWEVTHPNANGVPDSTLFLVAEHESASAAKTAADQLYLESICTENRELFTFWVESGIPRQKALDMIKLVPEKQVAYHESVNNKNFNIQKHFTVEELDNVFNWSNIKDESKREVLWSLGMNTKGKDYYTMERMVRVGTKLCYTWVVYGEERADEEWLNTGYCDGGVFRKLASESVLNYAWEKKHGLGDSSTSKWKGVENIMQ